MSAPRLVQNFRDTRATVVADAGAQLGALATTMERLGMDVRRVEAAQTAGALAGLHEHRDIVLVDGDLAEPVTLPLSATGGVPQAPVIGLIGVEAPGRLRTIMALGATALLRKPVHGAAVYSALYLGVNEHRRQREFERRIEQQEERLRGRRFVMRAVVQLAVRDGLDEDGAFALLRRESMRKRLSLEAYCAALAPDGARGGPVSIPTQPKEAHHAKLRS